MKRYSSRPRMSSSPPSISFTLGYLQTSLRAIFQAFLGIRSKMCEAQVGRMRPGSMLDIVGREIGSVSSGLRVGSRLRGLPAGNPVRAGYGLYFGGEPEDRHIADQTAVLYAVRGLGDRWEAEAKGYMDLRPDMTFQWRYDRDLGHAYLLARPGRGRAIEREVEGLMLQPPRRAPAVP